MYVGDVGRAVAFAVECYVACHCSAVAVHYHFSGSRGCACCFDRSLAISFGYRTFRHILVGENYLPSVAFGGCHPVCLGLRCVFRQIYLQAVLVQLTAFVASFESISEYSGVVKRHVFNDIVCIGVEPAERVVG